MVNTKLMNAIQYLDNINGDKKAAFEAAIIIVLANQLKLPAEKPSEEDMISYFNSNHAMGIYSELDAINEQRPISIENVKIGVANLFQVRMGVAFGFTSIHSLNVIKCEYDFIWDTDKFMPPSIKEAIKNNGSLFSTLINLISLSVV